MLTTKEQSMKDEILTEDAGPMLNQLLIAQQRGEESLEYETLRLLAGELLSTLETLNWPLLWPVDELGGRLVGAAVALGNGQAAVRSLSRTHADAEVLLVTVVAVSPLALVSAATHARHLGASSVWACGVAVPGVAAAVGSVALDGYVDLGPVVELDRRSTWPTVVAI
jgi:hypothetical protein